MPCPLSGCDAKKKKKSSDEKEKRPPITFLKGFMPGQESLTLAMSVTAMT